MVERFGKEQIRSEYRINKKGAECFRTGDRDEAKSMLEYLQKKRPGVYTMQKRQRRENKYGQPIIPGNHDGWSNWA